LSTPILSLVGLVGVFVYTAFLYLLCGVEFLGLILILVYIGAIIVLFIFIVMLLANNFSKATEYAKNEISSLNYFFFSIVSPEYLPFSLTFGGFFVWFAFIFLGYFVELGFLSLTPLLVDVMPTTEIVGSVSYENLWKVNFYFQTLEYNSIFQNHSLEIYGFLIYFEFWYALVLCSFILLLAMFGSILLLLDEKLRKFSVAKIIIRESRAENIVNSKRLLRFKK
jgi:NADH:ubiquinone oxidoreductase subunit 6 (subunit J)